MRLEEDQRVSFELAESRALAYLATPGYPYVKANCVAIHIWPGHQMTAQGSGAAASRILKRMEKRGLVRWNSGYSDWGWGITSEGRKEA